MSRGDEAALAAEATRVLTAARPGDDEVLAAGVFGLQDLMWAQVGGGTVGALGGDLVAGTAGMAVGAALGGYAAKLAACKAEGITLQLLVAVTPSTIHVLNRDPDGELEPVVASFPRSSTEVQITKFGLSRLVRLHDRDSDVAMTLHGTAAPFLAQSKPDAVVLHLLAASE
ncbi:hypothetical protein [Rhabdothermincola salaria]|uniref:hypothetical protein n=1 Tax=Rhabdothermincola salaria TaxID=2903142 RepID=UPI001E458263|nr:hypothetical protein [Rhabdothermincola salaria]MCD9624509.1 hypothetical protein [Rhabdothermincola salaria]